MMLRRACSHCRQASKQPSSARHVPPPALASVLRAAAFLACPRGRRVPLHLFPLWAAAGGRGGLVVTNTLLSHCVRRQKHAALCACQQVSEYGAGSALRMLGLAYRPWASERLDVGPPDEAGLVFVGLVGMQVGAQAEHCVARLCRAFRPFPERLLMRRWRAHRRGGCAPLCPQLPASFSIPCPPAAGPPEGGGSGRN